MQAGHTFVCDDGGADGDVLARRAVLTKKI